MKYLWTLGIVVFLLIAYLFYRSGGNPLSLVFEPRNQTLTDTILKVTPEPTIAASSDPNEAPMQTTIATGLDTPWAVAVLPDGEMLVTERPGRVRLVNQSGILQKEPVATLEKVKEIGEGGLMGIALHPDFNSNKYVYLYYTYNEQGGNTQNRVARMTYANNTLSDEKVIVNQIPGAQNHNGGRIKFGPDKNLYITTGDAQTPSRAQDTNSLAGKILRVNDEGKKVEGNPFNNLVYSSGHRNPQGIAWDSQGNLWSSEHGPSGAETGNDEINLIEPGKNYGWPDIRGVQSKQGMEIPVIESGRTDTWAPGGVAVLGNKLFFVGLRGQALYSADITDQKLTNLREHFKGKFGRLREVIALPDGNLLLSTSNQDGRGRPNSEDDLLIKINPAKL